MATSSGGRPLRAYPATGTRPSTPTSVDTVPRSTSHCAGAIMNIFAIRLSLLMVHTKVANDSPSVEIQNVSAPSVGASSRASRLPFLFAEPKTFLQEFEHCHALADGIPFE